MYYYYSTTYATMAQLQASYAKDIREYEKMRVYERNIVCSVPQSEEVPKCTTLTTKLENPG